PDLDHPGAAGVDAGDPAQQARRRRRLLAQTAERTPEALVIEVLVPFELHDGAERHGRLLGLVPRRVTLETRPPILQEARCQSRTTSPSGSTGTAASTGARRNTSTTTRTSSSPDSPRKSGSPPGSTPTTRTRCPR